MADSINKRLSMQNEILKRVEELSEKMQRRASEVTKEMRNLEAQAGAVECDLKNTFNSFRILSNTHFVEHRISDEDELASHTEDSAKISVDREIPAQSYEIDILPRYKEALSLGLTSYRDHVKKVNKRYSTSSSFKLGSIHGPLPHIIGSEEYIHDNSCGLVEDLVLGSPFDFSGLVEPKSVHANAEEHSSHGLFNVNLFGMEQGPPEKDVNEPLVSAALDFKAMLEAALLIPYKFYDEESSAHAGKSDSTRNEQMQKDLGQVTIEASRGIGIGISQHFRDSKDTNVSVTEGNLSYLQGSEIHPDNFSALISGSLFDTEEETFPSCHKQYNDSALVAESTSGSTYVADGSKFSGSPSSILIQENSCPSNDSSTMHVSVVTSVGPNEETHGQGAPLELGDDMTPKESMVSSHDQNNNASPSTIDGNDEMDANKGMGESLIVPPKERLGSSEITNETDI